MNSFGKAKFKGEAESSGNNVNCFASYSKMIPVNVRVRRSFDRTVNCGGTGSVEFPFVGNQEMGTDALSDRPVLKYAIICVSNGNFPLSFFEFKTFGFIGAW